MYKEEHLLVLEKPALRNLQKKVIEKNINELLASVNTRAMSNRGWVLDKVDSAGIYPGQPWKQSKAPRNMDAEYLYELHLRLCYSREDDRKPESGNLRSLLNTIYTRAIQIGFGKWELTTVDNEKYVKPGENGDSDAKNAFLGYADVVIPDDWDDNFSHLFGLDSHIARVKRAIEAAMLSNWSNRYHCALVGPPGCGKSDICQSLKRALGDDAVLEFDATATTAAGAIKELAERETLPRILLVEEIEKADEKSMSFLLAALDLRGEIRKTTARGNVQRDTKLLAIATVNDIPLFERLQAGALASRFANKLWFKRPSKEQLTLILKREIAKVEGGSNRWVKPTLDYCLNRDNPITDPRAVTAICLCGREMLLNGEYQKMLEDTSPTESIELPMGA